MQRTVKFTKFTYAVNTIEGDKVNTEIKTVEIPETNEKRALKKAHKQVGAFVPLKTETTEKLYVLDDEVFFKYAQEVKGD